jgi:hypothetical protein
VPVLPSTAAEAGKLAFSVEDAVAGFPWEIRGSAAAAVPDSPVTATAAAIVTAETVAASSRLGPRATVRMDMALCAVPASTIVGLVRPHGGTCHRQRHPAQWTA